MEGSCKFTQFGIAVKTALMLAGRDQKWLAAQITARTGMYADSGYLYKILTGQRAAPKVVQAIRDILGLEEAKTNE